MVAAGPGDARHLTLEAREAIGEADIVFGAPSVIARAKELGLLTEEKRCQPFYKAGQVLPYMKEHPELRRAAVLLSGDTGLYSGAAQLRAALEKEGESVRFRYLPGISSVAALAAALQVTWEDAAILSNHGRKRDVIGHLRRERKVFLLTSGLSGVHSTAELLKKAVAGNVLPREIRIGYGFNLSQESGRQDLSLWSSWSAWTSAVCTSSIWRIRRRTPARSRPAWKMRRLRARRSP
jgi:precorrin-6Y C5,15-methyltransferase (decarboxylating)